MDVFDNVLLSMTDSDGAPTVSTGVIDGVAQIVLNSGSHQASLFAAEGLAGVRIVDVANHIAVDVGAKSGSLRITITRQIGSGQPGAVAFKLDASPTNSSITMENRPVARAYTWGMTWSLWRGVAGAWVAYLTPSWIRRLVHR